MDLRTIFMVLCLAVSKSFGQLRCYTCGFTSVDSDQSCLTITNTTRNVDCSYDYCVILRQEFVDPPGVIASFYRGCDDQPDYLNHDVIDSFYRTYYRACAADLCNKGDGIQSVVGGNLSPEPDYTGQNLLVPGTGGGTLIRQSSLLALVLVTIIIC